MPGYVGEGNVTTDGTEQTLITDTSNRVYILALDTSAMQNGDVIELRIKTKVRSGGAESLAFYATYAHAQGVPVKYSIPVAADISIKCTIKRIAGTNRSYDWKLLIA